ncbi:MAG TPA: hypothetical protein VGP21_01060, partial [Opitutaceae bacterium]|nr:hypothetical protein [Opitutaceae bacterium]
HGFTQGTMAILMALLRFSRGGGSREKGVWPGRGRRKIPPETAREFQGIKRRVNFLKIGRRRTKNGRGEWGVTLSGDPGIRIYARAVNSFNVSNE